MVLDGAVDPSLSAGELTLGQAEAFESSLRTYVEDCQAGRGCPLTGDVDSGIKQIQDFLETTRTNPVSTSDPQRPLTYSLAFSAVLGILYQPESWSYLILSSPFVPYQSIKGCGRQIGRASCRERV